jgi:phage portal protein BeeE
MGGHGQPFAQGNAWGVITGRSGSTLLPAQVDLVHPDRVAVTTEEGRRVIRIGGQTYDRADLFHVKAYPWPGQLEGLSPIGYARWRQLGHGSPYDGRREIAVLGNGARFRPLAIAPEESQFIQTQKFSVSTICRFYGIPPEMMAGETAGHEAYTSPEMRGTDLLTFTLRPWLTRVERAVSGLLPSTQSAAALGGPRTRGPPTRGRHRRPATPPQGAIA